MLASSIKRLSRTADPLISECSRQLGASSADVFWLDTASGWFQHIGAGGVPSEVGSHCDADAQGPLPTAFRNCVRKRRVTHVLKDGTLHLLVPISRGKTVVAVIEFQGSGHTFPTPSHSRALEILRLLAQFHEEESVHRLLEGMRKPIDYTVSRDAFLRRIGETVLASTGAQQAALREYVEGRLVCLGFWGKEVSDLSRVSWPADQHEPFERAYLGETAIERDLRRPGLEALASNPELADVRSFMVVPIEVGTGTIGVLSIAYNYPFDFAPLFVAGVNTLSNGIGVALVNYRSHHGSLPALEGLSTVSMSLTAAEIAQSARHEVLDQLQHGLNTLTEIDDDVPAKDLVSVKPYLDELSSTFLRASVAVDKIKLATRPPSFETTEVSRLSVIWKSVLAQFSGRLAELDIDARQLSGFDPLLSVYPDWFRHVFLHLVLNSIDAFEGRGVGGRSSSKRGREIVLSTDPTSASGGVAVIRYSDNAGGINPTRLSGPRQFASLPVNQRIFAMNVTSKTDAKAGENGSGWGLFLVRQILELHGGSIDLERYRGGVTFRIEIPCRSGDERER